MDGIPAAPVSGQRKNSDLDKEDMDERHHLTYDTFEEGKLTIDEYLGRVFFIEPRSFSKEEFIKFMFDQSEAFEETINFFKELRKKYQLKVIAGK